MGQYDIPVSMAGGFKNLAAARAHREIMAKAGGLRSQAEEATKELMQVDVAEIDSTPSDQWKDLASGLGHVIMVGDNEDGSVRGLELNYDPASGKVRHFVAEVPEGKLTQSGSGDEQFSPTYKWEENKGDKVETSYFKFDNKRGVLSILDLENEVPAVLGDVKIDDLTGKTLQGYIPILAF